MRRVSEVIDCWFDSGAMPLAQWHYPFENKGFIDKREYFPADFICEGIDQTRGWFYTLLAISTLLEMGISYKNVVVNGIVLDEKGQKMSKSKGNIVVPQQVIDKYGADCVRLYFYTINQVDQPKRFAFKDMDDLFRKFFLTLTNCLTFYEMYTGDVNKAGQELNFEKLDNFLDKWIISRLSTLVKGVSDNLEKYDVVTAARALPQFVDDLSNWYVRRSRKRFQQPENIEEKQSVSATLRYVLLEFSKLSAPFTPFISEYIYQVLKERKDAESVHLCQYPKDNNLIDSELEKDMQKIREIASLALAQRAEKGIRVRQPLLKLQIPNYKFQTGLLDLIKDEVNVKEVVINDELRGEVKLDTEITDGLKNEGEMRDIVRQIQRIKKELAVEPKNRVSLYFVDEEIRELLKDFKKAITKETLAEIVDDEKEIFLPKEKKVKIREKETTVLVGVK